LAITSANSSPPMRATCSAARVQRCRRLALVVDLLEAVEIEQQHCKLLAGQCQPLQRSLERLVEGDAVGQVGQGIQPHRALRLDLLRDAPRERERIDEHAA
jgi:hypothetical protein